MTHQMIYDLLHFTGQDFTAAQRERTQEDFKVLFKGAPLCFFFALLNLNSTMTRAAAKGYFSLFFALSLTSFLLCLATITPPAFSFRLLRSNSALTLFRSLFHFTTSDLLTLRSSATFSHFFLTFSSLKRSRCSRVFVLNSTVYDFRWLLPLPLPGFSTSCSLESATSSTTSVHSLSLLDIFLLSV